MIFNTPWFKKAGWVYRPITWQGWLITVVFAAFAIHIFVAVDSFTTSPTDTLYGIFPYIVPAFLMWLWAASNTSEK